MDMGRYGEAVGHLKSVLKADADNVDGLIDLGICYTAKGFYAEAHRHLRRAETLSPEDALCHYYLAGLAAAQHQTDEALGHLKRAATREPERVRMWADSDRLFDALRADGRFQDILRPS